MGVLEFADAHPVWTLFYLLIMSLTLIICVNEFCTRSPHKEMLKLLVDTLKEKGIGLNVKVDKNGVGIDIEKPEPEIKGPRPLNG